MIKDTVFKLHQWHLHPVYILLFLSVPRCVRRPLLVLPPTHSHVRSRVLCVPANRSLAQSCASLRPSGGGRARRRNRSPSFLPSFFPPQPDLLPSQVNERRTDEEEKGSWRRRTRSSVSVARKCTECSCYCFSLHDFDINRLIVHVQQFA